MKRRDFLNTIAIVASSSFLFKPSAAAREKMRKLNIIFILADDLGWSELGCYGNTFNETPYLDGLARNGMRFTQAYAAAPVCSPYRASLMTGQYPAHVGITDYLRPNDKKHLPTNQVTVAEMFKRAGYATGIIGKWHLTGYKNSGAKEVPPRAHGFEETIISENRGIGGGSYFYPYHFNREIKKRLPGKEYLGDRFNLEAIEFVERHKDEPFFLYLSHYAVHTSLLGKEKLVEKYESKPGSGRGRRAHRNNPHLAAQLEVIDKGVGMILEKLKKLGIEENTAIIFTSDNGGESRVTSNSPLRGGKSQLYEGGIREPLIVYWPGRIKHGSVCRTPVASIDFYPTMIEMAGIKPDHAQILDGLSLVKLFKNPDESLNRRDLFWHYPLKKNHFLGGRSAGAVRSGNWKLIEYFDTGEFELFNLATDPGEKKNLSKEMPVKVKNLLKILKKWQHKVGAKIYAPPSRT